MKVVNLARYDSALRYINTKDVKGIFKIKSKTEL